MEEQTLEATTLESSVFEKLMRTTDQPEMMVLVGGPLLLATLIAIIFAIVVAVRRRRDKDLLDISDEIAEGKSELEVTETTSDDEAVAIADDAPADVAEIQAVDATSWLQKLKLGLTKTREGLKTSLSQLFPGKTQINPALLEKIHEGLFRADLGVVTTEHLIGCIKKRFSNNDAVEWSDIQTLLRDEIFKILEEPHTAVKAFTETPWVILIVGVNGAGKTTTIAKLTATFLAEGKSVLLCAADTYRAAAIDQLKVWGKRLEVDVVAHKEGSDPAAVAYDGVKSAIAKDIDLLLVDTAGRLHSKKELMDELGKIARVLGKDMPDAPHETWLVIDATTGQNAMQQIKAFNEVTKVTGLIVTKLDGTAKGGVVIGASHQFQIPIRYVGVGEKAADLRAFNPKDFADSII